MHFDGPHISCDTPKALLLLLHGYGASGNNLFPLASALLKGVPDVACFMPDAPYPCEQGGPGFQWFSLRDIDFSKPLPSYVKERIAHAGVVLQEHIERSGFTGPVFVGGFSQGGCLAMHMGLFLRHTKGVLCFSGFYPPEYLNAPIYTPPLFWYHGGNDDVVPLASMHASLAPLYNKGYTITTCIDPTAQHYVTEKGIKAARAFLQDALS